MLSLRDIMATKMNEALLDPETEISGDYKPHSCKTLGQLVRI